MGISVFGSFRCDQCKINLINRPGSPTHGVLAFSEVMVAMKKLSVALYYAGVASRRLIMGIFPLGRFV